MHVAARGQRAEHLERGGRQAGEAEQRQPPGQVGERRLLDQTATGGVQAGGGVGHADAVAQAPPELRLPERVRGHAGVVAGSPRAQHRGAVAGVAVEELGDVPHAAEPPLPARVVGRVRRSAEVRGEHAQPGLCDGLLDDLEQRPHDPLDEPRIALGVDPRSRGDGVADEPARRRERHVRADPVGTAGRRAEPRRQLLRQPALHPAGRHGHDLARERVGRRVREQRGERLQQAIRPFSSMDVQHGATLRGGATYTRQSQRFRTLPIPSTHHRGLLLDKDSASTRGLAKERRDVDVVVADLQRRALAIVDPRAAVARA